MGCNLWSHSSCWCLTHPGSWFLGHRVLLPLWLDAEISPHFHHRPGGAYSPGLTPAAGPQCKHAGPPKSRHLFLAACTHMGWTVRLCTENARKRFNKKVGQRVRHRAQPDKCNDQPPFTPDRPLFYLPPLCSSLPPFSCTCFHQSLHLLLLLYLSPSSLPGWLGLSPLGTGEPSGSFSQKAALQPPHYRNLATRTQYTPSYPRWVMWLAGLVSPHCLPYHLSVMFVSLFVLVYGFLLFLWYSPPPLFFLFCCCCVLLLFMCLVLYCRDPWPDSFKKADSLLPLTFTFPISYPICLGTKKQFWKEIKLCSIFSLCKHRRRKSFYKIGC